MKKKIVGIDVHGVMLAYPKYFKRITAWLKREKNAEIYVISGPPRDHVLEELNRAGYVVGYHYDRLISVVDFLKHSGVPMYQNKNGNWYASEDMWWWSSKAWICKIHGIEAMVDDSVKYKEYFDKLFVPTKFILFDGDMINEQKSNLKLR